MSAASEAARARLAYNAGTGQFTWLVTASSAAVAGSRAGCMDRNGYIRISIDGRRYLAHRLAWLIWRVGCTLVEIETETQRQLRVANERIAALEAERTLMRDLITGRNV